MLWAAGFVTVLGLVLLSLGWRGRLLNRNPVCRRCRFDLVGLWPGVAVCPECGGGLESRAVRQGQRQRHRGLIALGCVLLLIGAGAGAARMTAWGRSYDWDRHKPVAWLVRDARGPDQNRAARAIGELERRVLADGLPKKRAPELADLAIASAGPVTAALGNEWADLFTAMLTKELLAPEYRERFLRATLRTAVEAPSRGRAGESIPVLLRYEYGSFGSRWESFAGYFARPRLAAAIDGGGVAIDEGFPELHLQMDLAGAGGSGGLPYTLQRLPPEPGDYTVEFEWTVEIRDGEERAITRITTHATHALKVVGPGEPVVELVGDDALAAQLLESAMVSCEFSVAALGGREYRSLRARVIIRVDPPLDVVSDIIVRWSGQERQYGTLRYTTASRSSSGASIRMDAPPPHVDIILRPNAEEAAKAGCDRILANELIFRNVPVSIEDPRDSPAFDGP